MDRRMAHGYLSGVFSPDERARVLARLTHVRAPVPVRFPVEEEVGETDFHLMCRTILHQLLREHLGPAHSVHSDLFVYWDSSDPRRCLSPDVCVRLRSPQQSPETWKTWERGAPHLAVEIASAHDVRPITWGEKLERYGACGVEEVVRFDADQPAGARLRVWDRVEGDLVERVVEGDRTPCVTLGLHWVVAPADGFEAVPRLARDETATELLPTLRECVVAEREAKRVEAAARAAERARADAADAAKAAADAAKAAADAATAAADAAKVAAFARIAQLEAELRRRG
jgi:Uma2 family endonuclease